MSRSAAMRLAWIAIVTAKPISTTRAAAVAETAQTFRLMYFFARYMPEGGLASTGSSRRNRSMSTANSFGDP